MIKMLVTKAVISKGYEGAPALRFSENAENPSVRFRISKMVYDKRAEKERRFININVKAFSYLVDRIKSMKLDAGSCVTIFGRYDEETWEDQNTHEKKSAPVIIVDEIEFGAPAQNGNGKDNGQNNGAPISKKQEGVTPASSGAAQREAPTANNGQPANFTGFEGYGTTNPYFPEP